MAYDNYNIYEEDKPNTIAEEHDFSNVVPLVQYVDYMIKYLDYLYFSFLKLTEEEEEKNKQFKEEYRKYNYKKWYTSFETTITGKNHSIIYCKEYESFKSAIKNGNLENIDNLRILMNINFKRGIGNKLIGHEHTFKITFKPYDVKFIRNSSHNDEEMNRISVQIIKILNNFSIQNTIFCTK